MAIRGSFESVGGFKEADFDKNSMISSIYSKQISSKQEARKRKYQVRVEIRSSNQDILQVIRADIERFITDDLTQGHFIIS